MLFLGLKIRKQVGIYGLVLVAHYNRLFYTLVFYGIASSFVSLVEEIVALKKLKMEKEREGFPITSLREINTLLKANHPNIVHVKVKISSYTAIIIIYVAGNSCW